MTSEKTLKYQMFRTFSLRVDLDCIVPYLTLAKSTRLPILLCKIANLAGAPQRTVGKLRRRNAPNCQMPVCCLLIRASPYSRI